MRCFLTLLALMAGTMSLPGEETGFVPLFNGQDLTGWKVIQGGKKEAWGAEEGVMFVKGGGGGWLVTEKEYDNFELRFEFKLPKMGNSGVALRTPAMGDPAYVGMEIQLLDDATWKQNYKELRPVQYTGAIYDVIAPSKDATKPFGEWNTMRIVCSGRRVTVELNGVVTVDANVDEFKDKVKTHPGLTRTSGHVGFQSHDGRVEFRHVRLKPLQ